MRLVTRLILFLGIAMVALTAAFFQVSVAKEAIPGAGSSISVSDWDRSLTAAQVNQALLDAAQAGGANVYKQGYAPDASARRYYSYIGNPSDADVFVAGSRFDSFDPKTSIDFLDPLQSSGVDVRGDYAIQGSASSIQTVASELNARGFVFSTYAVSDVEVLYSTLVTSGIIFVLLVLGFCVFVVFIYDALKDARSNSVRGLFGYSPTQVLTRKLRRVAAAFAGTVLVAVVASVVLLWFYNGLAQFGSFLASFAVGLLIFGLLVVTATVVGTQLALRLSFLDYLRGESAHGTAYKVAFAAKAVVFVLVAIFLVSGLNSGRALASSSELWEGWQRQPDLVATSFSPALVNMTDEESASMQSRYRQVIVGALSAGPVVVASSVSGNPQFDSDDPSPEGNSMVVNSDYLKSNEIRGVDGQRVSDTAFDGSRLTLLLPQRYSDRQDSVVESYREWLDFQRSISTDPDSSEPVVDVELIADGQTVFNYAYIDDLASSYSPSPVLAVVDPRSPLLSDDYWAAAGSRGQVLFGSDPAPSIAARGLQSFVPFTYAIKDRAQNTYFDQRRSDIVDIAGTVIAVVVAGFAAAALGALYIDANRRSIYIRRTFGWTAIERHWRLFALTVAVQLGIVAALSVVGALALDGLLFALLAAAITLEAAVAAAAIAVNEAKSTPELLQQH
jgi:hypothetical protein